MSYNKKARKTHLCQVCGDEDYMYKLPIRTEPDIPICADCVEKIVADMGCNTHEDGCEDCPYFQGYDLDLGCAAPTYDLAKIGYDPNVKHVKPYQISLFPEEAVV